MGVLGLAGLVGFVGLVGLVGVVAPVGLTGLGGIVGLVGLMSLLRSKCLIVLFCQSWLLLGILWQSFLSKSFSRWNNFFVALKEFDNLQVFDDIKVNLNESIDFDDP